MSNANEAMRNLVIQERMLIEMKRQQESLLREIREQERVVYVAQMRYKHAIEAEVFADE